MSENDGFQITRKFTFFKVSPDHSIKTPPPTDISLVTSGSNCFFTSDHKSVFMFDRYQKFTEWKPNFDNISFIKANSNQQLFITGLKSNSYFYSLVHFNKISSSTLDSDFDQKELKLKTIGDKIPNLISISNSFKFLVAATKSGEIFLIQITNQFFANIGQISPSFKSDSEITNLFVTDSGKIFFTNSSGIFSLNEKNVQEIAKHVIKPDFAFLNSKEELIICFEKFLYKYSQQTSKFILKDHPKMVGPVDKYTFVAFPKGSPNSFLIFDLDFKLIAFEFTLKEDVEFVNYQWQSLIWIFKDEIQIIQEKPANDKISDLCLNNCFELALTLAQQMNLDESIIADIHKRCGDHLFEQSNYEESIKHYIKTIGHTEPSHVISKFIEPSLATHLANFLSHAQKTKNSSKQHTTLLFNCYTKIGAKEKLESIVNQFIDEGKRNIAPSFDIATAVDVLKRNKFDDYALNLAIAYRQHHLVLQIHYEKQDYESLMTYLEGLRDYNVQSYIVKYGYELITKNEKLIDRFVIFCVKLCTQKQIETEFGKIQPLKPDKLAPIFVDNNNAHYNFLFKVFEKDASRLSKEDWNTFVEMSIRTGGKDLMNILKHANPPFYAPEQALVYLNALEKDNSITPPNLFREAKCYLYEQLSLYPLFIKEAEPKDLLKFCEKFGEAKPSLWSDGLLKLCNSKCEEPLILEFLAKVQERDALPFMTVMQIFQKTEFKLHVLLPFIKNVFLAEQKKLQEANTQTAELKKKIEEKQTKIHKLTTENYRITQPVCASCQQKITSQSYHFLCGHSYCFSCLGAMRDFCPMCKDKYIKITEEKIGRLKKAENPAEFEAQSPDGEFENMLQQINSGIFSVDDRNSIQQQLNDANSFLSKLNSGVSDS